MPQCDYCLVGGWPTPLKNMSQLGWLFPYYHIPNIWKNKKCSKPQTRLYNVVQPVNSFIILYSGMDYFLGLPTTCLFQEPDRLLPNPEVYIEGHDMGAPWHGIWGFFLIRTWQGKEMMAQHGTSNLDKKKTAASKFQDVLFVLWMHWMPPYHPLIVYVHIYIYNYTYIIGVPIHYVKLCRSFRAV